MLPRISFFSVLLIFLVSAGSVSAHTPLFSCFDNGDGTIYCEGAFSDGSSASGVPVVVEDGSGKEIFEGKLSKTSDIEFDKPEGEYTVIFSGGEGHSIEIPGSEIWE
ncbi:MAG: hypothetical protein ACLFP9_09185 [Desulfonatronovibrio sp.]